MGYKFSRKGVLNNTLHFDTPLKLTEDEWEQAIDLGLGSHATSLVTRARSCIGQYRSLLEQQFEIYGIEEKIDEIIGNSQFPKNLTGPLRRYSAELQKYKAVCQTQKQLKELIQNEQKVDPNAPDGDQQQRVFKNAVRHRLQELRGELLKIDIAQGRMTGRADHIVAEAITQVNDFCWPFAPDASDVAEKNTRRKPISAIDQLQGKNHCIYNAHHEFPDGLTKYARNRIIHFISKTDATLDTAEKRTHFKNWANRQGNSRGPLTASGQYAITGLLAVGSLGLIPAAMYLAKRNSNTLKTIATGVAKAIRPITQNTRVRALINTIDNSFVVNLLSTFVIEPFTILSSLIPSPNQSTTSARESNSSEVTEPKKAAALEADEFSGDELLIPSASQGNLFTRGGLFGSLYDIADPVVRIIKDMGEKDPIMGSIALAVWTSGAAFVAASASVVAAHAAVSKAAVSAGTHGASTIATATNTQSGLIANSWHNLGALIAKIPGVREYMSAFHNGVMPGNTATPGFIDGFTMAKTAYVLMSSKSLVDDDEHALDSKLLHFITNNPLEAMAICTVSYLSGGVMTQILHTEGDVGSWKVFDEMGESAKPMVISLDTFLAMKDMTTCRSPEFAQQVNKNVRMLIVSQLVAKEDGVLRQKVMTELNQIPDKTLNATTIYQTLKSIKELQPPLLDRYFPKESLEQTLNNASLSEETKTAIKSEMSKTAPDPERMKQLWPSSQQSNNVFTEINDALSKNALSELEKIIAKINEPFDNIRTFCDKSNQLLDTSNKATLTKLLNLDCSIDNIDANTNILLALKVEKSPTWTLIKQYPELVQRISGKTVETLEKMRALPASPAHWQQSILATPLRAVHGLLLGGTVGLAMKAYYWARNEAFPPKAQQYSGYNNLLGLGETLPMLPILLYDAGKAMNRVFISARAKILERAFDSSSQLRQGNVGGAMLKGLARVGAGAIVAIDSLIAIPSMIYNGIAQSIRGTWDIKEHLLYKLPLGIGMALEKKLNGNFQTRLNERLSDDDYINANVLGTVRDATTGRASDVSSYRRSRTQVALIYPPGASIKLPITISKLGNAQPKLDEYLLSGRVRSHIMARIQSFIEQYGNEATKKSNLDLYTHIFPQEAAQLEKEFDLQHAREALDGTTLNKKETILASLSQLMADELAASQNSRTAVIFKALEQEELSPLKPIKVNTVRTDDVPPTPESIAKIDTTSTTRAPQNDDSSQNLASASLFRVH